MQAALITLGGSAGLLALLLVLFHLEKRRGRRFFEKARAWFDGRVSWCQDRLSALGAFFGQDFFRHLFHYFTHHVLRFVLELVRKAEAKVDSLVRQNKVMARKVRDGAARTKLDQIEDHKADVALTEAERMAKKEESIGGKF